MAEQQIPPSFRDDGKGLAELAILLGTETTIPIFRLNELTSAELQAITLPDDDLSPQQISKEIESCTNF